MQCLVLAMRRFADSVMALRMCQEPVEGTLEFDREGEARSWCGTQAGLTLVILLPCPRYCWLGL